MPAAVNGSERFSGEVRLNSEEEEQPFTVGGG